MSGYCGFSMSNNAINAYESGEKPLSKWTKKEILRSCGSKATLLNKVKLGILKEKLLVKSSWHHTSKMYNRTDFYIIDDDILSELNDDTVRSWTAAAGKSKNDLMEYTGNIHYIEWSGPRKYPKANKKSLENVTIQEKGCFYIVKDNAGTEILRKKIGSNGTSVIRLS